MPGSRSRRRTESEEMDPSAQPSSGQRREDALLATASKASPGPKQPSKAARPSRRPAHGKAKAVAPLAAAGTQRPSAPAVKRADSDVPGAADSSSFVVADVVLARLARQAALGIPGVAGVGTGLLTGVATYALAGQVVRGVKISRGQAGPEVEIHLTTHLVPLHAVAEQVRNAVALSLQTVGPCRLVDVYIDGLVDEAVDKPALNTASSAHSPLDGGERQ